MATNVLEFLTAVAEDGTREIMNFDTMTDAELDAHLENLTFVSKIIIDERRRIDAVELIGEQIQLDLGIQFQDDRNE